jgi:hypothetical protein
VKAANDDPSLFFGAFYAMDSTAIRTVLANSLASGDPGLEAVGLAGTLERGIPGAAQQLTQLWPSVNADPHARGVVSALRDSWRDPTPAAVEQVASFAGNLVPGSEIRAAAVRALAAIHTKESLRFLASLLPSSDASEQERAVYGLSAFANGCPIQTNDNVVSMAYLQCNQPSSYKTPETSSHFGFRSGPSDEESALVEYWRGWWNDHQELH